MVQHLPVQRQGSQQLTQLTVFLFQYPEPARLHHTHSVEVSLPAVDSVLADAHLVADLGLRRALLGLMLAQGRLLRSVSGILLGRVLLVPSI